MIIKIKIENPINFIISLLLKSVKKIKIEKDKIFIFSNKLVQDFICIVYSEKK